MTTEKEIADLFNNILDEYFEQIKTVAHEENSQQHQEPNELLDEGVKRHIDLCLSILVKLYQEYIKPPGAHIENALELIPLFCTFGLWIGASLGVSQEEYYKIVDYYLIRYDLLENDLNENETKRNIKE